MQGDGKAHPPTPALPGGPLPVAFEDVSFAYTTHDDTPDQAPDLVLRDISFRLAPGRVLGLLGRTGSGKTTLTRLLFRLYDPLQGQVLLADTDVRSAPLMELRQRVGIVTQNVQLFHASVRDNLTFFDPAVPDADLLHVIQELGLTRWFESLDDGLNTTLAPGGGDRPLAG